MSDLFFEHLTERFPHYKPLCTKLVELKEKKLYYQLSNEIATFVNDKFLLSQNVLIDFYELFIGDIISKFAPLTLLQFVLAVIKQCQDVKQAETILNSIEKNVETDLAARCLFYSVKASLLLSQNLIHETTELLNNVTLLLRNEEGIESVVWKEFYRSKMLLAQRKNDPNAYYDNGVKFLKYVEMTDMDVDEQIVIMKNLFIAALIGEKVYHLADVLNCKQCGLFVEEAKCSNSTPGVTENIHLVTKLYLLVKSLNEGKMSEFVNVLESSMGELTSEQIVITNKGTIMEKASVISLMELVFRTISTKRVFSFDKISEVTQVTKKKVELLVMRAMNLGLVKGFIDQMKEEVTFTWVMPRVLDRNQFMFVKEKLDEWVEMTGKTLELLNQSE